MVTTGKSSLCTKRVDVTTSGVFANPTGEDCVLYLGTGGDVNMKLKGETVSTVTKNMPQGINLVNVSEITPTGTTATDMQLWF